MGHPQFFLFVALAVAATGMLLLLNPAAQRGWK
jgi:hypothetical protein